MRKVLVLIAVLVALVGIVNFVTFAAFGTQLGSEAQNVVVAEGHFYVLTNGHMTEVGHTQNIYEPIGRFYVFVHGQMIEVSEAEYFYVSSHGHMPEVSEAEWTWSRFQAQSLCFTNPLAILAIGYLLFQYIFPSAMYDRRDNAAADTKSE